MMNLASAGTAASLALLLATTASAQTRTYLIDADLDELFVVNRATGTRTLVGATDNNGLADPADLSWRALTGELWTIDADGGELGVLDCDDGTFTPRFATGLGGWTALAWHELDKRFYLSRDAGDVYTFVPATGTLTLLGPTTFGALSSFDTDRFGKLFAISTAGDLLVIDRPSGDAFAASTTFPNAPSMAVDPRSGAFYAVDAVHDNLHEIDYGSGAIVASVSLGAGLSAARGVEILGLQNDLFALRGYGLYGVDRDQDASGFIGASSGWPPITAPNPIFTVYPAPSGLAYVPKTGQLWATDEVRGVTGTLDPENADFTHRWNVNFLAPFEDVVDLAWEPRTGNFIGAQRNAVFRASSVNGFVLPDEIVGGFDTIRGITINRYGDILVLSSAGLPLLPGPMSLHRIDPVTFEKTLLHTFGVMPWYDIESDWETDEYLIVENSGQLLRLQPGTWTTTVEGEVPVGHVATRRLASAYVIDEQTDQLGTIDLATGAVTRIGSPLGGGMTRPGGLAYWQERRELWTVDAADGQVGTVDPMTGRFQSMCETGLGGFEGIAWHSTQQRFYLSRDGGDIYELDPLTGELSFVGPCGYAQPYSLEVDGEGSLFTVDHASGTLVKIDLLNGLGSPVVLTVPQAHGLGFEPGTGGVFTVRDVANQLYRSDIDVATAEVVGGFGTGWTHVRGLQVIPESNATVARALTIGSACGGLSLTTQSVPRVNSTWWMNPVQASTQQPMLLALGYSDPQISLTQYGAPGCEIRTDAVGVYPIWNATQVGLILPATRSLIGVELFVQVAAPSPNSNALGAIYSNGLQAIIGW